MATSGNIAAARARFLLQRKGMFIHFSQPTAMGVTNSDNTVQVITGAGNIWRNTVPDVDGWLDLAVAAQRKYIILTCIHSNFPLWNSASNSYNAVTAGIGDVLQMVRDGCTARGLYLTAYLGNGVAQNNSGKAQYLQYMNEVAAYGPDSWWCDHFGGTDNPTPTETWVADTLARANSLLPAAPWLNNDHFYTYPTSDILSNEEIMQLWDNGRNHASDCQEFNESIQAESSVGAGDQWFYRTGAAPRSMTDLLSTQALAFALGANAAVNCPPMQSGRMDPAHAARLIELGTRNIIDVTRGGQTVTYSSKFSGSDETLLTGANFYGTDGSASFITNTSDVNPYFQFLLSADKVIHGVTLWNVGGGTDSRLTDLTIRVYDSNDNVVHTSSVQRDNSATPTVSVQRIAHYPYHLASPVLGRKVRITRNDANGSGPWAIGNGSTETTPYLNLRGVSVWASGPGGFNRPATVNTGTQGVFSAATF